RLDVFAETAQRFTAVLAAQGRFDLARSGVELAEQVHQAVSQRVAAGKEPPLQVSKSEAELELARLDATAAENAMAIARQKLAAMWGAQQPDFAIVSGTLSEVMQTVPSLDALQPYLAENPDLARWETELRLG
ncbi:MAG TPA: TolC family protein, partial [Verrucomicrobia bacterium]|nr:TolC family protein [Verrucomicrobiota bacterium]